MSYIKIFIEILDWLEHCLTIEPLIVISHFFEELILQVYQIIVLLLSNNAILVKFIMHSKYQLITTALLLCLALSITPIHKDDDQKSQTTTKNHPSVVAEKASSTSKSAKVPQAKKKTISKAPNGHKQVAKTAKTQKNEELAKKAPTKTVDKNKEKHDTSKKLQKQLEKSLKAIDSQDQSSKIVLNEKQRLKGSMIEKHQAHNFWVLLTVYSIILSVLAYGTKYVYFPHSNNVFELILDVVIKVKELKWNNKKGYKAPEYHEEVDDSNTVTKGYTPDHAKQLFWQKNSVQGI